MALLVGAAACSDYSSTTTTAGACRSTTNGPASSSPSTGVLTLAGVFYTGETVTLGYTDAAGHAATATGTAASQAATSITFVGLPSGNRSFSVRADCTDAYGNPGQSVLASVTVTIK